MNTSQALSIIYAIIASVKLGGNTEEHQGTRCPGSSSGSATSSREPLSSLASLLLQ